MRLGAYDCEIKPGTLTEKVYDSAIISERHRHRLEVNNDFVGKIESAGMTISGVNPELGLVEVIEHQNHPFLSHVSITQNLSLDLTRRIRYLKTLLLLALRGLDERKI